MPPCFGRTQMPSEATKFVRERYHDEDEIESILSMEDGTIQQQYKIMFPEFEEEKQQFDSNDIP
ncbi:hypothetical protein CHS0354_020729 [Potamilus streckersoni]|uniref:Uncharacterized protein n=1 Tax=Potamilus streckersoni TaxID=2493646 RepID=A0AAE0SUV0_9BIVA|nr:hypothetical protein CHS0354_020729 [Potamilus streckersoni]